MVVHPDYEAKAGSRRSPEARLEEAVGLALAIDLDVVHQEVLRLGRVYAANLFGGSKVEALGRRIDRLGVEVAIVDGTLTGAQQRNLETAWNCKVIDRTGLILEIFGERARTREGKLQVELAALTYQRSRLVRSWTHLERQRGGFGFLGGPGESQLEIDRRLTDERIARIKQDLERVKRTRALHRDSRRRVPYPVAALVGYTNAGKSTLFNRLAGSGVEARDMLFATLDPTMRRVPLPGGHDMILSDTVGFISDLPTDLVAAFRATLEEVSEADVLLHVRDVSHPDTEAQKADVLRVLRDMGLDEKAGRDSIEVLNKVDLLDPEERQVVLAQAARDERAVAVSAATGEGLDELLATIAERFDRAREVVDLSLEHGEGATLAWLYRHGEVVERREDDERVHLRVALDPADRRRLAKLRREAASRRDATGRPQAD